MHVYTENRCYPYTPEYTGTDVTHRYIHQSKPVQTLLIHTKYTCTDITHTYVHVPKYRHYPYHSTLVQTLCIHTTVQLDRHTTQSIQYIPPYSVYSSVITRGSGSKRAPSHSSTTRITPDDMKPTSCVWPPASAWTMERERLAAAVNELKNEPTIFIAPHAMNSWTEVV